MKTLLLFTLLLISGECHQDSIRVTAQLGAPVTITCRYPEIYTNNSKSFCIPEGNSCRTLVSLEHTSTEARIGRYSLTYSREERALNVTIDGLMKNDEAVYFCAVKTGEGIITRVTDVVVYVMGNAARSVHFRCTYCHGNERRPKHLYRGECSRDGSPKQKDVLIQTNQSDILITRGRLCLYDNTTARVFTVTISNLTAEDSGKYCCVVKREPLTDIQTEHLFIYEDNMTSTEMITGWQDLNTSSVAVLSVLIFLLCICIIICVHQAVHSLWLKRASTGPFSVLTNRKCGDQSEAKTSDPIPNTVYAVAVFPKTTCEDSPYSLVQHPRPDPVDAVYSYLQFPKHTPSSLEADVPTIPSGNLHANSQPSSVSENGMSPGDTNLT
ncbi:uncharacterized protein LOC134077304 [Sardina pilchardus]|uniref:uncharacterized protein LOC134077304 n=1 Tax=Sardina pilchardus TaxID=27697 RepID=UPI002E13C4CE